MYKAYLNIVMSIDFFFRVNSVLLCLVVNPKSILWDTAVKIDFDKIVFL